MRIMSKPHHNSTTDMPIAPDLKIQRQSQVDGAGHPRSGNHNQSLACDTKTDRPGALCITFPRLTKQNKAVEHQANLDKLRTQPLRENADLVREPDEEVIERPELSDLPCNDLKQ